MTHGLSHTLTYASWGSIRKRCTNPKHPAYQHYGGRGITVCERWNKFENFLEDMGHRPGHAWSLDRIDNDKGYEKSNCRWATAEEQANNRRSTKLVIINGESRSVSQWATQNGIPPFVALRRIRSGVPTDLAVTQPYDPITEGGDAAPTDPDVVIGRPFVDLTGQKFGRWTVIEPDGYRRSSVAWKCRCECGNTKTVGAPELRNGNSKSCGCLRREVIRERSTKHAPAAIGDKFNYWTVKQLIDGEAALCSCRCGSEKIVELSNLRLNKSKCCRKCSTQLRHQQAHPENPSTTVEAVASEVASELTVRQPQKFEVRITQLDS